MDQHPEDRRSALSPAAAAALAAMTDPDDPEAGAALAIPYGLPQPDRALALDHFQDVVGELRGHGHQVVVDVFRKPDGEAHFIALAEPAITVDPEEGP